MSDPSAARVDHRTYYADKVLDQRGSVGGCYCPDCDSIQTLMVFYATDRSGREEGGLQCVNCRTTWCINVEMARLLGLFPNEAGEKNRLALKGF